MTVELTEFISARLDVIEQTATALGGTYWTVKRIADYDYEIWVHPQPMTHDTAPVQGIADVQREDVAEWIAARDPRGALRDVEAKRKILAEHAPGIDPCDAHDASMRTIPCDTLLYLAAIWADHPDYREEWAP